MDHATIHRFDAFMPHVDLANDLLNESVAYLRAAGLADDSVRLLDSTMHVASASAKNKKKRDEDRRVGCKGMGAISAANRTHSRLAGAIRAQSGKKQATNAPQ